MRGKLKMLNLEEFKNMATMYNGSTAKIEDLVKEYKVTGSPICFSVIVNTLTKLITSIAGKSNYTNLADADKLSSILYNLELATQSYDVTKKIKFTTYVYTYLVNGLNSANSRYVTKKSVQAYDNVKYSYEECVASKDDKEAPDHNLDDVDLGVVLGQAGLTDKELAVCRMIVKEPHDLKNTEIARELGITSAGVKYIKNKIAKKLSVVYSRRGK